MYQSLRDLLLNRVNEIKPRTSWDQIRVLLDSRMIGGKGGKYVIGLNDKGELAVADMKNSFEVNQLVASKFNDLNHTTPDGKSFNVIAQQFTAPVALAPKGGGASKLNKIFHFKPSFPFVKVIPSGTHLTFWRHRLKVTPGTGVNGSLLDISQRDSLFSVWATFSFKEPPPIADEGVSVTSCGCPPH